MVVRMSATVKPILVAHHTDVAADDRTQNIIAIVKPLQAAERFPVIAPFSRGVGLRFIEPCLPSSQQSAKSSPKRRRSASTFREMVTYFVSIEICGSFSVLFATPF